MNANYIYDIFETTKKTGAPDLHIGLAMLKVEQPIPEGTTEKEIKKFLTKHYDVLVKAYNTDHREAFAEVVKACEGNEEEKG